ncbi:hypothetical protein FQR65_LT19346 [Abscondita terminalis]|nr:hypothetical protein FQR65_LT19346 [Abscondita terminalis]
MNIKCREHYAKLPEAGADFCENELSPLNQIGDREGCKWDDGVVTTPTGFKAAYDKYVELGFPSLSVPEEHGGQGLPGSLATAISEMVVHQTGRWGMILVFLMCGFDTIEHHGSADKKQRICLKTCSE